MGRRGSLYQSCRDITRRRCCRGSGGRASVQGAGPEARRSGNSSRGGGAQVAPPTQGKGQVAEAVSANGRRIGASVGGARPRVQLLQPGVWGFGPGSKKTRVCAYSPAGSVLRHRRHYWARFRQHCPAGSSSGRKGCQTRPQPTTSWSLIWLASDLPTTFLPSRQGKLPIVSPAPRYKWQQNERTQQKVGLTSETLLSQAFISLKIKRRQKC